MGVSLSPPCQARPNAGLKPAPRAPATLVRGFLFDPLCPYPAHCRVKAENSAATKQKGEQVNGQ
jgi:hypothetical protein